MKILLDTTILGNSPTQVYPASYFRLFEHYLFVATEDVGYTHIYVEQDPKSVFRYLYMWSHCDLYKEYYKR